MYVILSNTIPLLFSDSEVFRVRIDPKESSSILQLHGDYILSIVDGYKLVLAPLFPTQKIIEWNLAHITLTGGDKE